MTTAVSLRRPLSDLDTSSAALAVFGGLGCVLVGALAAMSPTVAILAAVAVGALVAVATRPVLAAYAVIALTPLTAGIDRGSVIPLLRPSEAILVLAAVALALRWIVLLKSASDVRPHLDEVSGAIVLFAAAASVFPLLWLHLRDLAVTTDDQLYALVIWKFFVVYLIIRAVRLTDAQRWRCLYLSVATAVVIGVVGALQAMGVGPVIDFLQSYYINNGNVGALTNARGSSTLSLPIAVADLMIFNLAIVAAMLWRGHGPRRVLMAAGLLLVAGVVGAGEFSGVIGLVVGVVALGIVLRSWAQLRYLVAGMVVAFLALWPVFATRLQGFQSTSGLPVSWTGRLYNLQTYFWPELLDRHNFLLGVRPAARVPAPHRANGFIWIESGYTWLLWAGGIPLLLAFCYLAFVAARAGLRSVRRFQDSRAIAGVATFVGFLVVLFLMNFDPHITYRGAGDELFALLAMTTATREVAHDD